MRDQDYILPCDVRVPPATTIRAGCSMATLKVALSLQGRPRHFAPEAPVENAVPVGADCAHNQNGTCTRPIGKHFSAGFNGYRSRLHVGCATERSRERDLTKRQCCGPSARFFEPKGAMAPLLGMQGTVIMDEAVAFTRVHDTVGDSDGDDGS